MRVSKRLGWLLLVAACAAPAIDPEEPPADREDVSGALHRQLDLVLARHNELAETGEPLARQERAELGRLANEITLRIFRIDPNADVRALLEKTESTR